MKPSGTIKISTGEEIPVDVSTLTQKEWRNFFSNTTSGDDDDKVLARLTGKEVKFFDSLTRDDYRRIFDKVVQLANRPLDDPN